MKIKLQDYGLISIEWIDKQIEIEKEKVFINDLNSWASERLSVLEQLKEQLIPSEKLAEVCLVKGGHIEAYSSEPYNEKQEFLKSEIEIL